MTRESILTMSARKKILLVWTVILLAGLACETGEILTPEEATQRAILAATQAIATGQAAFTEGGIPIGEEVEFESNEFLVPLAAEPGDQVALGHVSREETATVLDKTELEGEIWYLLETSAGDGWVPESLLRQVGGPEFAEGQTAYLTGTGFLINIYELPGSNRFLANQERGAEVVVRGTTIYEGDLWYMVEAPAATGWVRAENLTAEP